MIRGKGSEDKGSVRNANEDIEEEEGIVERLRVKQLFKCWSMERASSKKQAQQGINRLVNS